MTRMAIRPELRALPAYRYTPHEQRIKLDQNESPWDLPEALRVRALERVASAAFHRYPQLHAEGVAERIAALEGWPVDGVVVAGGSNVLIQAAVIAAGLGREVLSVTPSFSVYALQARLLGARLREVPLGPAFALPREELLGVLASGAGGVHFLAAPMAPTGNAVAADDVEALARAGTGRWLSVVDEAYGPFAGSDFSSLARSLEDVVSLRTLSKAYGLGGVRLGYALTTPQLAEQLRKAVMPFSVSALQAALVETVLEEPDYVSERIATLVAERERLLRELRTRHYLEAFDSVTNFVLFRVADAAAIDAGLRARDVVIRRQDHLPGLTGCLRVSVGTRDEIDTFLTALDASAHEAGLDGAMERNDHDDH